MKKNLSNVTLLGVDCVDIERLALVAGICQKDFTFADVKLLTSLPSSGHASIIQIDPITSLEAYSKFMISELVSYVDTPHVLVIQHDGFILNPDAWSDEYLHYDYVGAPWLVRDWSVNNFGFPKELLGTLVVGNGGFSLRSKRLLNVLSEMHAKEEIHTYHPEDVAICIHLREKLEKRGIVFAPVQVAKRFSFESMDDETKYTWTGQFDFHSLRWTDISRWLKEHPDLPINNTLDKDRKQSA